MGGSRGTACYWSTPNGDREEITGFGKTEANLEAFLVAS